MILSWLQNHLETLGGKAGCSWHFSCVQTVVKLQLHSVLATLYLLSMLKNTHFLRPLLQTLKCCKATWQVSQRLHQCNLFLTWVCRSAPRLQLPLPSIGPRKGTVAVGRFSSVQSQGCFLPVPVQVLTFFSSSFSKMGWFTKSSER